MEIPWVTQFFKGGAPKPPPVPLPPVPTTAADNASADYRKRQRERALGFSQSILTAGNQSGQSGNSMLGGKTLLGG